MIGDVVTHRIPVAVACLVPGLVTVAGCGTAAGGGGSPAPLIVAVDVPASTDAYTAEYIREGADLAVKELNKAGGVEAGAGTIHSLTLRLYDDAGDPQRAAANTAAAIRAGAIAIVEDGVGAPLSAPLTKAAGVPEIVIANGDSTLLPGRPSLFRLGIPNGIGAPALGGHISHKATAVGILHDDGEDGRNGAQQLEQALAANQVKVTSDLEVPAALPTVDAEVRGLLDARPAAVALWASEQVTGRLVVALHAAAPTLPLFSGPSAENPAVRRVAGIAATDGLDFVASRMTSENDAVSFGQFEHRLAVAEGGPIDAGIRNAAGQEIRQPADGALFSYDAVRVVATAIDRSGSAKPGPALLAAMTEVGVISGNGENRGFDLQTHEGLSAGDLYIATIHDMVFEPVKDDPLSATLPVTDEILADFH